MREKHTHDLSFPQDAMSPGHAIMQLKHSSSLSNKAYDRAA
jgi:hypothetical protein